MKARIVCPHCKAQGRLIRLTETDGDRLRCRHCNKSYTREEIAVIYENAARAFAEAAAKVRKQPMKEQRATPVHKYPLPDPDDARHWHIPDRLLYAVLVAALLGGCFLALGMRPIIEPLLKEVLR